MNVHTFEYVKMQAIPKPSKTRARTNNTPVHDVKSYFVWMENNVTPTQTNRVIPRAMSTDSIL